MSNKVDIVLINANNPIIVTGPVLPTYNTPAHIMAPISYSVCAIQSPISLNSLMKFAFFMSKLGQISHVLVSLGPVTIEV